MRLHWKLAYLLLLLPSCQRRTQRGHLRGTCLSRFPFAAARTERPMAGALPPVAQRQHDGCRSGRSSASAAGCASVLRAVSETLSKTNQVSSTRWLQPSTRRATLNIFTRGHSGALFHSGADHIVFRFRPSVAAPVRQRASEPSASRETPMNTPLRNL